MTILVSSGDDGVANFQARSDASKCGYNPSFPATSPYVTAVGATQGPESNTTETACLSNTGGVITTGGGFSTIFSAPSYQSAAISDYFSSLSAAETPASGYASKGRGYPDISMAGLNYEVVVGGKTYMVSVFLASLSQDVMDSTGLRHIGVGSSGRWHGGVGECGSIGEWQARPGLPQPGDLCQWIEYSE